LFSFSCAAEADLKRLADAVAEFQPALDVFIGKYGALDKVRGVMTSFLSAHGRERERESGGASDECELSLVWWGGGSRVQAKAKVPALQTGLEEAVNKLALASDSNQGALQIKKVVDSLKDTDAKQRHLKGVLFSRITSEKGSRPSAECHAAVAPPGVCSRARVRACVQRRATSASTRTTCGTARRSSSSTLAPACPVTSRWRGSSPPLSKLSPTPTPPYAYLAWPASVRPQGHS
jgi:hypothetical protein